MTESSTVLAIEDLRIRVRDTNAIIVDGVSFTLAGGQIMGLVGESGSGKTTTALAALGYVRRGLRITEGRVVLAGTDLASASRRTVAAARGRLIGYVPQDPFAALNPTMRIGRQLFDSINRDTQRPTAAQLSERGERLMDEVGLPTDERFLRRYPHQLSGGQRQRLTIAMAFACTPGVVVLDEPTTGLDVTTQSRVLDMVTRLCSEHDVAGLYVSHDLAVVHEVATHVAVMYAGAFVEWGPVADVLRASTHPYTRALLKAVPSVGQPGKLQGIAGQMPRPVANAKSACIYVDRCNWAIDVCHHVTPELRAIGTSTHVVACHRAEEVLISRELASEQAMGLGQQVEPSSRAVLEVALESANYASNVVLHQIELSLGSGECLAIVGESGSGKTTLARCIAGLHSEYYGEILHQGQTLESHARERRLDKRLAIQYIFQNPYDSLNPRKTLYRTLQQPMRLLPQAEQADTRKRLESALAEVALPTEILGRYPSELSGGQRQRVALARALMTNPNLLICDEVTSSLDVSVQAIVIELLRTLRMKRNLAILFITHDLALATSISDRIIVLHEGIVVETGKTNDVINAPTHAYTRELISNIPNSPVLSPE